MVEFHKNFVEFYHNVLDAIPLVLKRTAMSNKLSQLAQTAHSYLQDVSINHKQILHLVDLILDWFVIDDIFCHNHSRSKLL